MSQEFEDRFLGVIRHQLQGLSNKVTNDFSKENFENELAALQTDPVYEKFAFNRAEYVLVRFMGRISISVGRRLGEIYDKVPRFAAAARFNLTPEQIAPVLDGLELDIGLKFSEISLEDQQHAAATFKKYTGADLDMTGLGIEIRYNFNPNDSSRLRKDVHMGELLTAEGLKPIYLVFSSISPRQDAIARLTASGWTFLVGDPALKFISELLGMEIQTVLDKPVIKAEIKKIVDGIMSDLIKSHAFQQVVQIHKDEII
jgi:hypothetical protein